MRGPDLLPAERYTRARNVTLTSALTLTPKSPRPGPAIHVSMRRTLGIAALFLAIFAGLISVVMLVQCHGAP